MRAGIFLFLLLFGVPTEATISDSFYSFLVRRHGRQFADDIARRDFGTIGSFGGGNHTGHHRTKRTPTVFVTGWSSTATFAWPAVWVWKSKGYTDSELYGTTYGFPMGWTSFHWGLKCEYINATRNLIMAVAEFTHRPVNIVAYSQGGPVSRKAILGGHCVDTGEYLGPPLTHLVDVYLGVGGAMSGAMPCSVEFLGVCSKINGMNCHSKFIQDINSEVRYEGRTIYVLQSSTDDMVGYRLCGKHPSEVVGANKTVTLFGYTHMLLCTITPFHQFNFIHKGDVY
ncbi:Triacylglycerol lipase [Aphelenchoides fujianensis]|nr:Triacylglycerol lipase [Aphelenchoides fujianensis]